MSELPAYNNFDRATAEKKFQDASRTFTEALRRIARAANETHDGKLTFLTQAQLSQSSNVSEGAIKKYMAPGSTPANPTLEVICKLAHSLGVPPAFLLMTSEDWTRLSHAIVYYLKISNNEKFVKFAESVIDPQNKFNHREFAEAGLALGALLGLIQRSESHFPEASAQRISTAASCLAPPMKCIDIDFRPLLLTICTIIGASTAL